MLASCKIASGCFDNRRLGFFDTQTMPKQHYRERRKNGVYQPDPNDKAQLAMNDPALCDIDEVHVQHGDQACD